MGPRPRKPSGPAVMTAQTGRTQDCTRPTRQPSQIPCNAGAIHTGHSAFGHKRVFRGVPKNGRSFRSWRFDGCEQVAAAEAPLFDPSGRNADIPSLRSATVAARGVCTAGRAPGDDAPVLWRHNRYAYPPTSGSSNVAPGRDPFDKTTGTATHVVHSRPCTPAAVIDSVLDACAPVTSAS